MFWGFLDVQLRVWGALFMRDMQTRWGRRNLGFAWLFAEPLIFAVPVLTLWMILRPRFDKNIPMMPFLWSGYLPILIFRHITAHALNIVRSNAALLYHRHITPFDLYVGRCFLEAIGNLAATGFSFLVFYVLGILQWPVDVSLVLVGFLLMTWWALAVALIFAAISERSELVHAIWVPASYVYMLLSGFPFMAAWLPKGLRDFALTYDPPLLAYEIIRAGLFGNLVRTYLYPGYLIYILATLSLIGLWLIRHVRQYVEE